jgi:uncharacterized protein YjiS (DUF1127 family)
MATTDFRTPTVKNSFSIISMIAAVVSWNDCRMTRNSLSKLTTRELDDIGLVRGDIEAIATGTLIR